MPNDNTNRHKLVNYLPIYSVDTDTVAPEQSVTDVAMLAAETGNKVLLFFEGLDDDAREVYDIPSVVLWCQQFITAGGLTYLANQDTTPGLGILGVPPQLIVVACAKLPGTCTRNGQQTFTFHLDAVAALEKRYRVDSVNGKHCD